MAEDFDDIIRSILAVQRPDSADITGELLRVEVHGRPVDPRRDYVGTAHWTGGDLGSIAWCVGVLVHPRRAG